jgi:hypothetical protein
MVHMPCHFSDSMGIPLWSKVAVAATMLAAVGLGLAVHQWRQLDAAYRGVVLFDMVAGCAVCVAVRLRMTKRLLSKVVYWWCGVRGTCGSLVNPLVILIRNTSWPISLPIFAVFIMFTAAWGVGMCAVTVLEFELRYDEARARLLPALEHFAVLLQNNPDVLDGMNGVAAAAPEEPANPPTLPPPDTLAPLTT